MKWAAAISLSLGIASVLLVWVLGLGIAVAIVALVFGLIGLRHSRGLAIAGIVTSGFSVLVFLIVFAFVIVQTPLEG